MKKVWLICFISTFILSSCDFFGDGPVSLPNGDSDNYYLADDLKYTLRDINSQLGWVTSKSTGTQKFLIVPVNLSSYSSFSYEWNEEMISNVEKAFFGDGTGTTFESVSSYFYKSSYGNLIIEGEVIEPFNSTYSEQSLSDKGQRSANYVISEWYRNINTSQYKDYDADEDGFIDNCIFLYPNMYNETATNGVRPFWAWCSAHSSNKSMSRPQVNNYMWASYQFLFDHYSDYYNAGKLETHTFIHETGHLLGLDDYYSYDANNRWDPAGILDMQAYNVGDHNAYSKMALGWIKPYVVTGNAQIKLKTSSSYPEAILINDKWNGSAFDEYLLIEYYTPTGLNEVDSKHPFNYGTKMYDYKGLRIYHVDARLVETTSKNGALAKSNNYVDELSSNPGKYTVIGASNSIDRSRLESNSDVFRLLHLLDEGGKNKLNNGIVNMKTALWKGGKNFSPSSTFFHNNYLFNDFTNIGYTISVSKLTNEECIVTILKS